MPCLCKASNELQRQNDYLNPVEISLKANPGHLRNKCLKNPQSFRVMDAMQCGGKGMVGVNSKKYDTAHLPGIVFFYLAWIFSVSQCGTGLPAPFPRHFQRARKLS